jgi:hypothetical protein
MIDDFSADEFLEGSGDAPLSTKALPIPYGDYRAYISAVSDKVRVLDPRNEGDAPRGIVDLTFQLDDADPNYAQAAATTGRTKLTSRMAVWLDLTHAKKLERGPGKNTQLGKILDAAGLNAPGAFKSFQQLVGTGPWVVRIEHEADKNDPESVYDRVKKSTKA